MARSSTLVALLVSGALLTQSAGVVADPGNGKGHDKGKPEHAQKQRGGDEKGNGRHGGPSVDHRGVLGVLSGYRDYWRPGPALPPGVQKNLARGKPLPPGIAKKLDARLVGHLPRYEGYEWMQAGTDLILVAVATGLIYEVWSGALD